VLLDSLFQYLEEGGPVGVEKVVVEKIHKIFVVQEFVGHSFHVQGSIILLKK
jgi:hypothetical protein